VALFKIADQGFGVLGNTAALSIDQAVGDASSPLEGRARLAQKIAQLRHVEWVPDLGSDIGSARWFRGFVTCGALCAAAIGLSPGVRPLMGAVTPALTGRAWDEARAQSILPLAYGSDSGRRMAATSLAIPISNTPERPTLEILATLGQGDGFARVLERVGVGSGEAQRVASLVAGVAPLADIPAGTVMPIILGERASKNAARPLQSLDLRASFDMKLEFRRVGGALQMRRVAIAIDRAPLRIQGVVGDSLYRSARAAGVPVSAVESYIRVIAAKASLDDALVPGARFDIILENARSASGESQPGKLLYAGLVSGGKSVRLIEWSINGQTEWFEASGVSQRRAGMVQPVANARMSSGFGMRFHPILGYSRFHKGVDFAAVQGTPVYAVTDGLVAFAGGFAGYGNHIRLSHSANLGTSYSHLSRIVVAPGARVAQGQLIGYVGTTGLSTGPHLHFEVYRAGVAVNPTSVSFSSASLLDGRALQAFQGRLSALQSIPVTGTGR
jgi:murein DD-endopeptidase MepM/ murein hydrolase activator NlpD